jgi:hypothetical protein
MPLTKRTHSQPYRRTTSSRTHSRFDGDRHGHRDCKSVLLSPSDTDWRRRSMNFSIELCGRIGRRAKKYRHYIAHRQKQNGKMKIGFRTDARRLP